MANKLRSIFMLSLMPLFTVGVLLFLLVLYLPSQAASGLFTVNSTADTDDGSCNVADCTLREAINAANNTPDGDIIVFSLPPSSTITLNGNQLPTITGTLKIDGSTVVNLTISGDNQSRVFVIGQLPPPYPRPGEIIDSSAVTLTYPRSGEITGSSAVTLTHLTVVNGNDDYGGGISNGGNLTIINSHFTNNHGIYGTIYNNAFLAITNTVFNSNVASVGGGAIFNNFNGDLSVSTTQFIENAAADAWSHGGSIYNKGGTVTIIDSDFISNTATPAEGAGYGGAIFNSNSGNLLVENSDFHQNSADSGGALWNNSSADVIVSSSIFKLNSTEFSAGGAIANIGILTVTNSAIISNSAASGFGGIYNSSNPLYLSNSTIIGNIGGGISAGFGTLRSVNNTIYSNVGVGLFFLNDGYLSNTIIANSIGGADCLDGGLIVVNVNNLIEDGTCNPMLSGDPLLGPLQDNGGGTLTLELLPGSPAIDQGHPDTCAAPPVNNLDQRGQVRPKDGNGDGVPICDIGSYELEVPDFTLVKYGPELATPGELITYTLYITSNLPVTVTNIVLTDTMPVGAAYISGGTLVGNVVSWTMPSLTAGSSFSRSFVVTATHTITNHDYRVSASGGYSTTGETPVITSVVIPITGLSASNDSPTILDNSTNFVAMVNSGSDVSFDWDFGDGGTGSGANVAYTYPAVGQYTAVVTASNPLGVFTATTNVTILDVPISGLSATNDSPTIVGNPTTLMATTAAGTNVVYAWDFGDGTGGTGASVMHTYPAVGQYTAVVTASNTSGSVVDTTIVTIEQDTWTIYLPVVLTPVGNSSQKVEAKLVTQHRFAILPNWLLIYQLSKSVFGKNEGVWI